MDSRELLIKFLKLNRKALHPGKGRQNAQLVREVCQHLGLDEDDFLPSHVKRNKKGWGL